MTISRKQILIWAIIEICVFVAIWWTFYFPYSRERLFRAVPGNALIISEHPRLARRWQTCLRTPLVRGILNAQAITDRQIDDVIADPQVAAALEMGAGRNTVIAYVPALDTSGRPAWLFASWVGWRGQPLRWGWAARHMQDFDQIPLGEGRNGWRLKPGKLKGDMQLSLAASEGILLGCLSESPSGVKYILDRIDGKFPLSATVTKMMDSHPDAQARNPVGAVDGRACAGPMDRAWFEWHMRTDTGSEKGRAMMGIALRGEAGADGWFSSDLLPELPMTPAPGPDALLAPGRLMGNVPAAVAVMTLDQVRALIPDSPLWGEAWTIGAAIGEDAPGNAAGFAAMLTGDYSGEIAGMKICAILAGVKLREGADAMDVVGRLLDTMTAEHGWQLIPKRHETNDAVILLDSTRPGTFKLFAPGQGPAFTALDGWLVFCTNMKALERLLAGEKGEDNDWLHGAGRGAGIYLAGDLDAAGKAVENAVAAYTLIMNIQEGRANRVLGDRLDLVRAWASIGSTVKTGSFRLCVSDGQPELQFTFAPAAQ